MSWPSTRPVCRQSSRRPPWHTKIVIREVARRRLPADLLERKKVGFAVPVASWFRGSLGDALERLAFGPEARPDPLVDPERVRRALALHRAGRYDFGKELWSVLTLDVWARIFLDGADPSSHFARRRLTDKDLRLRPQAGESALAARVPPRWALEQILVGRDEVSA